MPGAPLSWPPAASAAAWNASTVARSAAANATCVPVPYGSRWEIQNSGFSDVPKPAAFHSSNAITTLQPSGASACS